MFPIEIDNTDFKYYMWNYPEQYESGVCWIVKTKRVRKLLKPQNQKTLTKNPITTKM
jgi:hypothetical protein